MIHSKFRDISSYFSIDFRLQFASQDSIDLSIAMLLEVAARPPPALPPCADRDDALARLTTLASSCAALPAESCRTPLKAVLREQPRCREECRWLENVSVSIVCPKSCQASRGC
jgi:hypothetical protein